MTWTLELPVAIPSANELMRGRTARARRGRYQRLRKAMAWAVRYASAGIPKAEAKRRVLVSRVMGPRQRDYDEDNLIAGCKPLIDEIVAHGLLRDDSPAWARISYAQERGPAPAARVEIWDEVSA